MSYYRNFLENWLAKIEVKADKVLDIGGGEKPIKDRVALWNVKDYKIADNDVQFKPDYLFDMNLSLDSTIPTDVDVIFCLEVAEYIWDPVQFHENIYKLLNKGGIAYISYPTIYPLHNPPEIDYLRYSKNAIKKLLTESGFTLLEMTSRVATAGVLPLSDFYRLEGMHPIKHDNAIFDIGYMVKVCKQ